MSTVSRAGSYADTLDISFFKVSLSFGRGGYDNGQTASLRKASMQLARLIYISEPLLDQAHGSLVSQLASIMSVARRNNKASNITGALVYDEFWFLQVLEGERRSICHAFDRISEDERHTGCLLVEMAGVDDRLFGNWWMGLATRDSQTAPAFAPFVRNGTLRADIMSAHDVVTLMTALARLGLRREMRSTVALNA